MNSYVILLRGVNVGGKNKVPMAELKACLEKVGFEDVLSYIQSGNVILRSKLDERAIGKKIEQALLDNFKLDSELIRVVAIEYHDYKKIVDLAPKKFGKENDMYRYNVVFLMGVTSDEAMKQISTREGVDEVWQGDKVIYFCNTFEHASRSHLSRITQQPIYPSITIRNWNTTIKLFQLLEARTRSD